MSSWLHKLGDLTEVHRENRAKRYDEGARKKRAQGRLRGAYEVSVEMDARWYTSRARGQRNKIANVEACGAEKLHITCQNCGASHDRPGRCGNSLLCVSCRGAFAADKRHRFLLARLCVISAAERRGLLDPRRRGGRYSEKFLTLTSPHFAGDSVASRINRLAGAWVFFRRWLKTFVKRRAAPTFEWFRVLEWTPGKSDDIGHPHLHLWLFSCYLDFDALQDAWRLALIKAGAPEDSCRQVIIDIEEFEPRGGKGAYELIKYLTKDIDANGDKISEEVYAEVYKAFDGRRINAGIEWVHGSGRARSYALLMRRLPPTPRSQGSC